MFMLGLAVGGKNHLPMSTGKPPDIHHKSTTQRKSPFHLVRHSNLFEVPSLKTNSHFQWPNLELEILKKKKTHEKFSSIQQAFGRDVEISADQIAQKPPYRNVCQPRFFHKTLGFWGGGSKTVPNRSSVWNRTPTNLKVALKNLQVGEVETLEVETQI